MKILLLYWRIRVFIYTIFIPLDQVGQLRELQQPSREIDCSDRPEKKLKLKDWYRALNLGPVSVWNVLWGVPQTLRVTSRNLTMCDVT